MLIKFPKKIDKEIFKDNYEGQTKYGLPKKVLFCKSCVISNQMPNSSIEFKHKKDSKKNTINFDESLICDACKVKEKKAMINWELREQELKELCEKFRRNDGTYDCLVPGSGGKDSFMQAHLLKYKYGMNPLTVTYAPLLYTNIGRKNMQNWIDKGGFDNYVFSPNGQISSILAREALKNLYFPIQPFKFGIKSFAMKMALRLNINLVMFGEDGTEYGSNNIEKADSPSYDISHYINDNKDIYIAGMPIKEIINKYNMKMNDLYPYMPIRTEDIKNTKIHIEHLAWYVKWDPQEAYYYASENCGFESDTERTDGTYSKYTGIDDKFESLHFYTQYIKFMIGRTRYDASQEIRNGHIEREEGIALAKKYEGEIPKRDLKGCLEFLNISEDEFWKITDKARSPHLWTKKKDIWVPKQELPELLDKYK